MWGFLGLVGVALAQTPIAPTEDSSFVSQERAGGELGIGIGLGAPTGFVGKYWLGDWSAVQFGLGGNLGMRRSLGLNVDYVVSFRPLDVPDQLFSLPVYMGAGIRVDGDFSTSNAIAVGPRAVFGASAVIPDLPIDLYVEVAPTVYLLEIPSWAPSWSMDGQIGVHYYY